MERLEDDKSPLKLKVILGISTAALLVMIIIVAASTVVVRAKNPRRKSDWNGENIEAIVMLKRYSYAKVKKMTNSFAHVLGKGGFGTVYKGKLLDGSGTDFAVKILKDSKGSGEEFINEVASMSRTSHVNIVSLLGFCYEGSKRAIIYEFMPNGSLDKYISENMSTKMEWETLYNIAVGVARGLEYLHNRCVSRIVHFDIKPQNILMDQDLCPKIADFGLAKLCKKKESIISMLNARGTIGYIAPEVFSKSLGGVSYKSDVYSFGMVVLEIVGAKNREMLEKSGSNNSSMYFPDWIYKDLEREETMKIFGDEMCLIQKWCLCW
uniref:Protein kinase domain-containing protein n=1 Tax=Brassica oleracea var. oleracea TaxID=109376 RepID=A0A0D3EF94_BRAOL